MPVLVSASETSCDNSVATAEKTTFTYDNLGNVRTVSYGDGTDDKVYTYDKNSNLTSLEYGDVIRNYTYNDLNLVESERLRVDGFDWTISYLYDNHGNRKNVVYPGGGSLWYQPNALGQPQRVGVFATSISFHPNGLYKSVTLKNGCVNTQTLHTSGYPNIQRSLCGTSNIVYNQYSYDGNGNITFWDDKQSNTYDLRLTYDGLDRLDNIRNGNNSLIGDLNYDSLGNIEKFDSIAGTINYTYDANERLYSTSGMRAYTFTYDDRGNVEDNGFDSFTYNLANEMRSASGNSYVYDGHGKRVKAVDSEGTRYSMYSLSGQLLYERINGAYRQNYYLGSQLIAHQGAGEQTFIHPDILGTTAGKTNSDGGLIKPLRYAPFGLEWGKTNASSGEDEIGYTGHKHDKSIGLTYMQARYYDPVIGRFYSNDPVDVFGHAQLEAETGFVHGFNRYSYVGNNPYKYTDPTGECRSNNGNSSNDCPVVEESFPESGTEATIVEVNVAFGAAVSLEAGVVKDSQGNKGLQLSVQYGGGTPEASIEAGKEVTSAESISELNGASGTQTVGGGEGAVASVSGIVAPTYKGGSITGGLGAGLPAGTSGGVEHTLVIPLPTQKKKSK
ncbi:MAG TPA: hypothetical protein DCW74_11455 [Alteromonas australica]|uniref:Teneurin-like YD-shell domain-containing protein n=1 Tax=Alteromonas australica TaxID=589873 RepID=A0A358DX74_9ALTE|nr:RHS repeat-associated core domain-containing protein [Alteromonas australica]MBU34779.1 hypothetical protein [Alteromonas sp.]HAW76337.1 hypothetical protein [Alteromonas australica]HBU50740.1 hypothetical protein [Alteromonas australica]|tara:strand:+ start:186 stop:2027 length:1842 start_codon:yes stop_codon:yes gene_type:complete